MRIRVLTSAGMLALVALGCTSDGPTGNPDDFTLPPGAPPPVTTDAAVYTLKVVGGEHGYFDAEALATYTNGTGRTVYYARCSNGVPGPIYWLRRTGADSTTRVAMGIDWACAGGTSTGRILPGKSVTMRVWLGSGLSPDANPPITPEQRVGRFRIVLELCTEYARESSDCTPLPQSASESNAFEVRFATP